MNRYLRGHQRRSQLIERGRHPEVAFREIYQQYRLSSRRRRPKFDKNEKILEYPEFKRLLKSYSVKKKFSPYVTRKYQKSRTRSQSRPRSKPRTHLKSHNYKALHMSKYLPRVICEEYRAGVRNHGFGDEAKSGRKVVHSYSLLNDYLLHKKLEEEFDPHKNREERLRFQLALDLMRTGASGYHCPRVPQCKKKYAKDFISYNKTHYKPKPLVKIDLNQHPEHIGPKPQKDFIRLNTLHLEHKPKILQDHHKPSEVKPKVIKEKPKKDFISFNKSHLEHKPEPVVMPALERLQELNINPKINLNLKLGYTAHFRIPSKYPASHKPTVDRSLALQKPEPAKGPIPNLAIVETPMPTAIIHKPPQQQAPDITTKLKQQVEDLQKKLDEKAKKPEVKRVDKMVNTSQVFTPSPQSPDSTPLPVSVVFPTSLKEKVSPQDLIKIEEPAPILIIPKPEPQEQAAIIKIESKQQVEDLQKKLDDEPKQPDVVGIDKIKKAESSPRVQLPNSTFSEILPVVVTKYDSIPSESKDKDIKLAPKSSLPVLAKTQLPIAILPKPEPQKAESIQNTKLLLKQQMQDLQENPDEMPAVKDVDKVVDTNVEIIPETQAPTPVVVTKPDLVKIVEPAPTIIPPKPEPQEQILITKIQSKPKVDDLHENPNETPEVKEVDKIVDTNVEIIPETQLPDSTPEPVVFTKPDAILPDSNETDIVVIPKPEPQEQISIIKIQSKPKVEDLQENPKETPEVKEVDKIVDTNLEIIPETQLPDSTPEPVVFAKPYALLPKSKIKGRMLAPKVSLLDLVKIEEPVPIVIIPKPEPQKQISIIKIQSKQQVENLPEIPNETPELKLIPGAQLPNSTLPELVTPVTKSDTRLSPRTDEGKMLTPKSSVQDLAKPKTPSPKPEPTLQKKASIIKIESKQQVEDLEKKLDEEPKKPDVVGIDKIKKAESSPRVQLPNSTFSEILPSESKDKDRKLAPKSSLQVLAKHEAAMPIAILPKSEPQKAESNTKVLLKKQVEDLQKKLEEKAKKPEESNTKLLLKQQVENLQKELEEKAKKSEESNTKLLLKNQVEDLQKKLEEKAKKPEESNTKLLLKKQVEDLQKKLEEKAKKPEESNTKLLLKKQVEDLQKKLEEKAKKPEESNTKLLLKQQVEDLQKELEEKLRKPEESNTKLLLKQEVEDLQKKLKEKAKKPKGVDKMVNTKDEFITGAQLPDSTYPELTPVIFTKYDTRPSYSYDKGRMLTPKSFLQEEMEKRSDDIVFNGLGHVDIFSNFVNDKYQMYRAGKLDETYMADLLELRHQIYLMDEQLEENNGQLKLEHLLDRFKGITEVLPIEPINNLFYVHVNEFMRRFPPSKTYKSVPRNPQLNFEPTIIEALAKQRKASFKTKLFGKKNEKNLMQVDRKKV